MINFDDDKSFIENYEKLKSSRKMGELYKCDRKTITAHAKKIGYDYSKNKELKISAIPIKQVIKDYEQFQSAIKVGEKYGCSGTAVLQYLKKNNYKPKNFLHKLDEVYPEDFILKYEELKNAKRMGQFYNCSSTAIINYAKKINYDTNQNKEYKLSQEDKEEILQAYYSDLTSTELSNKYNVSRGIITKIWYDAGLKGKENNGGKQSAIDITGQKFGKWTVLYKTVKRNSGGSVYWHCRCECGIEKDVLGTSLRQGLSLSCGAHGNISKGNEKIKALLIKANIDFELEKKFPTCKDKKELPFDFYVNNSYLIEFDGEQHYNTDSLFDYNYTHSHDLIKNEWCKKNKIPLIRIPYTHLDNLVLEDLLLETSNFIEIMPTIN